jgi:hypothetical protein
MNAISRCYIAIYGAFLDAILVRAVLLVRCRKGRITQCSTTPLVSGGRALRVALLPDLLPGT